MPRKPGFVIQGMRRIGVSYGAHTPKRLSLHQPEVILDQINDLLRIIQ